MQRFAAMVLVASLLVNTAYAADSGALAPGNPAGVNHAQTWNIQTLAVIGGGAALIIGFSLLISGSSITTTPINGGGGNLAVSATTTTSTQ